MKIKHHEFGDQTMGSKNVALLAGVLLAVTAPVHASVVAEQGGASNAADFLTLSPEDVSGGTLWTGTGQALVAAEPVGAVGTWLAASPSNTQNGGNPEATVHFSGGASQVSFLWGTPDADNELFVNEANGQSTTITATELGLSSQSYVTISETGSSDIASLTFADVANNAFETANFTVTPVPLPATVWLMMSGLGGLGVLTRKKRTA